MESHSTSRNSRLRVLAFCTPELWIEGSQTESSSTIAYGEQNAVGRYIVVGVIYVNLASDEK